MKLKFSTSKVKIQLQDVIDLEQAVSGLFHSITLSGVENDIDAVF